MVNHDISLCSGRRGTRPAKGAVPFISSAWFSPQRSGGENQARPLSAAPPRSEAEGGNVNFSRGAGWRRLCPIQAETNRAVGYKALLAVTSLAVIVS